MVLNLQLCVLTAQPRFERYKKAVVDVAAALAEQSTIPAIAVQMELILDIQTDAWWLDVTLPILEGIRKKLRGLAYLIEKRKRKILYADFADEIGEGQEIVFERFVSNDEFAKFREKARPFLKAHENQMAVLKLLTASR
jgi:type I restriction enzyme R subunit